MWNWAAEEWGVPPGSGQCPAGGEDAWLCSEDLGVTLCPHVEADFSKMHSRYDVRRAKLPRGSGALVSGERVELLKKWNE